MIIMNQNKQPNRAGFTLVEIMVVVLLIGLLNAIAIPSFRHVQEETYANRLANDFRVIRDSLEFAISELGEAPRDRNPGRMPAELQPYLPSEAMRMSVTQARWDWENWTGKKRDFKLGMTLRMRRGLEDDALMTRVDSIFDDGDLKTGSFRKERHFGGYAIILE